MFALTETQPGIQAQAVPACFNSDVFDVDTDIKSSRKLSS